MLPILLIRQTHVEDNDLSAMLGYERVCDVRPQRIVGRPTLTDDMKPLPFEEEPDKRHGIFAGVEHSKRDRWASRRRHPSLLLEMHA